MKSHTKLFIVLSTITMTLLIIPWNTFAAPLAPDVRLSQADIIINSESSGDNAGASVSSIGDVNGDGLPDFAIGAPRNDSGGHDAGKVYIFFGKADGWGNSINLSQADASFIGERKRALAGYAISGAGDVNHDGFDDFLIGAPYDGESGSKAGQTYLILGKATGWTTNTSLDTADASFLGETPDDESGSSLAGIGDINGDGFDDFLIGAPYGDFSGNPAGQAYLFLGRESGWQRDISLSASDASFLGESSTGHAASSLAGAGDVNGDGYDDFLIGDWSRNNTSPNDGETYLIFGKPDGWANQTSLADADASFVGEALGYWSGYSLCGARDVNADGYDDFLIGAPGNDDNGRQTGEVYLVMGKNQGWMMRTPLATVEASLRPEWEYTWTGAEVADLGDINQDGFDDFAIGAILADDGGMESGKIYLVLGKGDGWSQDSELNTTLVTYWGENSFDYAGSKISGIRDINNDGMVDILVGAPLNDANGVDSGRAYILLGNSKPAIGHFAVDKPFVDVNSFQSLKASYYDVLNDSSDLDTVEIYIETKGKIILGRFKPKTNKLWLREDKQGWLASCVLGQPTILSSSIIELDCGTTSTTYVGRAELVVEWRLRVKGKIRPYVFNISLRALDKSGQDSGVQPSGFWRIYPDYREKDLTQTDSSFLGEAPRDTAGWDVAFAGDVNNDGYGDFLIGAPHNVGRSINGGKVYLLLGKPEGFNHAFSLTEADASFLAEATRGYNNAGYTIDGVGDVNGDGFDDFIIGAWTNEEAGITAGQVYLILGKADGWTMDTPLEASDASFLPPRGSTYFGCALSGVGDVNGDGYDDFIIGGWGYGFFEGQQTGAVWLIFGKPSGWNMDTPMSEAGASFIGEGKNSWTGFSVAGVGDVNQDGYDDFLIGAPRNDELGTYAGQVYLILGKESGWSLNTPLANADASILADNPYDLAGYALSGAGDVNGDGFNDFLLTTYGSQSSGDSEYGKVYLFFGKADGWAMDAPLSQASASFVGERAFDRAGQGLARLGDINSDGYDDFAIGAPGADDGGSSAGKVYIILGKSSGWATNVSLSTAYLSYWGESMGDRAGFSIAGVKDIVGAGSMGLLVGAPGSDESDYYNSGKSYLVLLKGSDIEP